MPEPITAPFWLLLTRLGEAQIVLPVLFVSMGWLLRRPGHAGLVAQWCGFVAGAVFVTLATKIAFIGFGVGVAAIDFTGVSGHAMFAALVYPLLARVLCAGRPTPQRPVALALGVGLAVAVAVSRVMVGAHSVSEVLAGLAVGGVASAAALRLVRHPISSVPVWLPLGLALWLGITPVGAPASNTHGLVTRLSLALSGRALPYKRSDLLRARQLQERQERQDRQRRAEPIR